MDWIFYAVVAGSILTSGHPSEEACLGRKAMLLKQNIYGECVRAPQQGVSVSGTGITSGIAVPYLSGTFRGQ